MAATVQTMIDEGMQLWAFCHVHDCFNRHRFDLDALRARIGPHASTMARDLVPRLRCSRCGGRNASIIVIPRASNPGDLGAGYRKALADHRRG
jgi:hypothetical protein